MASKSSERLAEEIDELSKEFLQINLSKKGMTLIDSELLYQDLPSEGPISGTRRNTFVVSAVLGYNQADSVDNDLLTSFEEDFNGWKVEDFAALDRDIRRVLRQCLSYRGIYLGHPNSKVNHLLTDLTIANGIPDWDESVLIKSKVHEDTYAYARKQLLLAGNIIPKPSATKSIPAPVAITSVETVNNDEGFLNEQITQSQQNQPIQQSETLERQIARIDETPYMVRQRQHHQINRNDPAYHTIPPIPVDNEELDNYLWNQFNKRWDKSQNYTGKAYDILDDKVLYFLDTCLSTHILPSQFHSVFSIVLSDKAKTFFLYEIKKGITFAAMYKQVKQHFDTEVNHRTYLQDWTTITFNSVKARQPEGQKNDFVALNTLLEKLQLCQRALGPDYRSEKHLVGQVIRATRGTRAFVQAMWTPASRFEDLASQLRQSLDQMHYMESTGMISSSSFLAISDEADQEVQHNSFFVDRQYNRRQENSQSRNSVGSYHGNNIVRNGFRAKTSNVSNQRQFHRQINNTTRPTNYSWKKRCYICGKVGCFSTKHPEEERQKTRNKYLDKRISSPGSNSLNYGAFLTEYEGREEDEDDEDNDNAYEAEDYDVNEEEEEQKYFAATYLSNEAFRHRIIGQNNKDSLPATAFILDHYTNEAFQGILPDTGAARNSTAGKGQFEALQKEIKLVFNENTAGAVTISFGNGKPLSSIGSTVVKTPIGSIEFHILDTPTPFLLCLRDMDRLGVYLNNVTNEIISTSDAATKLPIVRKFGHPWFFLRKEEATTLFLTEPEMRRLHARFGHPSVSKLYKLLSRSGHDVDIKGLEAIQKFCHFCQLKSPAPHRFKFSLQKDCCFNYEVIVDVMYLDSRPVLHVIDEATAFQAARFLASISAKDTWEALKMCWIDTYLGPPDIIRHDAGTNFAAAEFKSEAKVYGITCQQVPVESHWSIGKVERYHAPLRRAYEILRAELSLQSSENILQMAIKAVNDTAGPNGLVPTLLVFGAFPRTTIDSPPSISVVKRAQAITKAMLELRRITAKRVVRDALNTRNGPDISQVLPQKLPLGSEVRVFREKGGWKGPYKVTACTDVDVTVDMENGPTVFRSTAVKPYLRHPEYQATAKTQEVDEHNELQEHLKPLEYPPLQQTRRRGRPRKNPQAFLTHKERADFELAIKLRKEGKITSAGKPFEVSDEEELQSLLSAGIIVPIQYDAQQHGNIRIFQSRIVREVKNKTTKPYEKSRLVIQGYADDDKRNILTQSPTIQRSSQRMILALAPSLIEFEGMKLAIRDITQAYVQSKTNLQRVILARLPKELQGQKNKYPDGTLLRVLKPLYGIAESGVHWFATYEDHLRTKMEMEPSFDPCIMISVAPASDSVPDRYFGIVGLQTDDTILLGTQSFMEKEEIELVKADFKAKPRLQLSAQKGNDSSDFNGSRIHFLGENMIAMTSKGQAAKIELILSNKSETAIKDEYVRQRARGAYLATLCQPEAAFDLSIAAQTQFPSVNDVKKLNQRLQWQLNNHDRGLIFHPLQLDTMKLFVFTDGSFANNKDLSSQIGYIILLGNEVQSNENDNLSSFTIIKANIIHWSSTKCKRVTRSVLASEIYGLVSGFDISFALAHTLQIIMKKLGKPPIPLIVCTDSYSLYECLVKLGSTNEKRLMIDLMGLRQSYERREISEIRWIHGEDNPADAMTKAVPNKALEKLVESQRLHIRLEGWVKRPISNSNYSIPLTNQNKA